MQERAHTHLELQATYGERVSRRVLALDEKGGGLASHHLAHARAVRGVHQGGIHPCLLCHQHFLLCKIQREHMQADKDVPGKPHMQCTPTHTRKFVRNELLQIVPCPKTPAPQASSGLHNNGSNGDCTETTRWSLCATVGGTNTPSPLPDMGGAAGTPRESPPRCRSYSAYMA